MKLSITPAALLAGLILAAAVPPAATAATKMTIGSVLAADYLPAYIAVKEGFFAKRDLDVTMQTLPGGSVVPAVQSGSTQIAGVPVTNLLLGMEGGLNLRVVTGASSTRPTDKIWGLVSAQDISGPKDLVGKKIGVPAVGGVMYLMMANWLNDSGVKVSEVKLVEAPFDQVGELIKAGSIQAGASAEPLLTRGKEVSGGKILHYFAADFPPRTAVSVFATSQQWGKDNQAALRAFSAGIQDAVDFAEKNPDKAKQYLVEYSKLPPSVAENATIPAMGGEVTREQLQFWADTMQKLGMLKKAVDVTKLQNF